MKRNPLPVVLCLLLWCLQITAPAQSPQGAAWQATNFDITVANPNSERALNARAAVTLRNIGGGAASTLSLRMNSKAEIKSVTIGSAAAIYQSRPETRGNAQRVTITLPASIPPGGNVTANVEYRLPVGDNTGAAAISPIGSQFLPQSMWVPVANNAFAIRGADYAPFRLTVNGGGAISSGVEKSSAGNSVFEQSLNAQPFFLVGAWDRIPGGANANGVSAYVPQGAGAEVQKQAESLISLAGDARAFFASLFGANVDVPVRLVAVSRGAGIDEAGTILLAEGAFRRKRVDAATAMTVAEAMARLWIGAATPVRGEGHGVLREGLARFLATLFIEKQFGAVAAEAERSRHRVAYAAIARRDGPLARTTPVDATYFNSVANKGSMVWRLVDHLIGREAFLATLKTLLTNSKTDAEGLSLNRLRVAITERGSSSLKAILDQQLDQPTDTDLMAGLPHQDGGQWVAALRNVGSFETAVNVTGWTASGQQVTVSATVPAHDFGQVVFKSPAAITRVEIDPEKFYPQIDYANDVAPNVPEIATSLAEANRLFGAQDFAKSEALARKMLSASPQLQEARIVLGRALLAQNKNDEAEKEFKQLLAVSLPIPAALAWANVGLGEIALHRGQGADAVRYFTDAVRADAEYASTLAARAARIRAESTAGAPAVDESAKNFINQLDTAIRSGRQADIAPMLMPGELTRFVQQIVGSQPEAWQTRVLRSEQLDANRLALDVALNTKQLGIEHSGTAVFILGRAGGNWKLNAIELFEVK